METLDRLEPYVLSILRIMVGLLFMQHGLVKLFGFPTGAGFPAFLSLTWFEGCIEMIGGGLIVVGLFTRWAAFITSGEMAIGYFMVHAPKGFFPYANGGESRASLQLAFRVMARMVNRKSQMFHRLEGNRRNTCSFSYSCIARGCVWPRR